MQTACYQQNERPLLSIQIFVIVFSLLAYIPVLALASTCERPTIIAAEQQGKTIYSPYRMELFSEDVDITSRDLDGDGDDDLILLGAYYPYNGEWDGEGRSGRILINDGGRQFSIAKGASPITVHPREVLFADFDSNGLIDFFIADHGYDTTPFPGYDNSLMLQHNSGWVDASENMPKDTNGFTHNAAVGDVDGDGDVDIFILNNGGQSQKKYWLLNNGEALFEERDDLMPVSFQESKGMSDSWSSWATFAEDLNDDGFLDLFVGGDLLNKSVSRVYWGNTDGYADDRLTYLPFNENTLRIIDALSVVAAYPIDVNEDGKLDILYSGYGANLERFVQVWINYGDGKFLDETFQRLGELAHSNEPNSWHIGLRWLDFNFDGYKDIVLESAQGDLSKKLFAWLGDGHGYFTPLTSKDLGGDQDYLRNLGGTYVTSSAEFYSIKFFEYEGDLASNAAEPTNTTKIEIYPCRTDPEKTPFARFNQLMRHLPIGRR